MNFLDFDDEAYKQCLLKQLLDHDREPLEAYLSNRPFNVGIITAVSSEDVQCY